MIKGWIIHKQTAFGPRIVFLEHTHSTAQHWSLPVPIALAHLPNGLRAGPSQNVSNSCPSKDFQEETKEYVARNPSFSATVSLKFFVTKWVALHVSLMLASGRPPQESSRTHGSCQNSSLNNQNLQKTQSKKLRRSYGKSRRSYGKLRRSYDTPFFGNSLQNIEILNNTCSTAALQTCAARTISQRPDMLKQWEYVFAYVLSA